MEHLVGPIDWIECAREKYGVVLRSLTEPIDNTSSICEMIFAVLAGFAA